MTDKLATPEPVEPPTLSRFGPAAVDRIINRQLQEAIPGEARVAIFDVLLVNAEGERLLQGVVAGNLGNGWGVAIGGTLDLEDRDDWLAVVHVRKSW